MNAKITITVPMDKVHLKVSELLETVVHDMEDLQVSISDISMGVSKSDDILKHISELDKCRKQLTLLDANLEDCYSVLFGLTKFKTKQAELQNTPVENKDVK